MSRKVGKIQRKILLLLLGGLALGLSGSPRRYFKVLKIISKEWKSIDSQKLKRSIKSLYESKLVGEKLNKDGTITLFLTKTGKKKAITYNIDNIKIKAPKKWDKKWRIVIFDIPEKLKYRRDILRYRLKSLDFYELQKSVFVHPFDCANEIEYITELYQLRKYIRFIVANYIDNDLHLKRKFCIN